MMLCTKKGAGEDKQPWEKKKTNGSNFGCAKSEAWPGVGGGRVAGFSEQVERRGPRTQNLESESALGCTAQHPEYSLHCCYVSYLLYVCI